METKFQKNKIFLIFSFLLTSTACVETNTENSLLQIKRIIINNDFIINEGKVDSVYIDYKFTDKTSIYGAKLYWKSDFASPISVYIDNLPWSDKVLIKFDYSDFLLFQDSLKNGLSEAEIKIQLMQNLRIELYDVDRKSSISAFIPDTSHIVIHDLIQKE